MPEAKNLTFVFEFKTLSDLFQTGAGFDKGLLKKVFIAKGAAVELPYFSGNALRGRLRRECADIIFERIIENGGTVNVELANWMRAGAAKNPDVKLLPTVTPHMLRRELREGNIHTGLFGGGLHCPGVLAVGDLIPVCRETVDAGLIPVMVNKDSMDLSGDHLTTVTPWVRVVDLDRAGGLTSCFLDEAEVREANLETEGLRKQKKDQKKNPTAENTSMRADGTLKATLPDDVADSEVGHVGAVEAIAAGVTLVSVIELRGATDAQIGLFVEGFRRMARWPRLGANTRVGMGRIKFTATSQYEAANQYTLSLGDDRHFVEDGFDEETEAFTSWLDGLKDLDPARLLPVNYLGSESKADAKAKAKAKKNESEAA